MGDRLAVESLMGYPTSRDFEEARERPAPPAVKAKPFQIDPTDPDAFDRKGAQEAYQNVLGTILHVREAIKIVADELEKGHSVQECVDRLRELAG